MNKEYLDRKEVEKMFIKCCKSSDEFQSRVIPEEYWEHFKDLICQLKPKNQVVIAEGEVHNNCGYYFVGNWGAAQGFDKFKGKKGKLIFIEEIEDDRLG